jgi:uncharacterized protein (DUF1684 family)
MEHRIVNTITLKFKKNVLHVYNMLPAYLQLKLFLFKNRNYYNNDPYFKILKQYFKRSQTAIDIGANRGLITAYLLNFFEKVIAVEPNPEMVKK